MWEYVEYEVIMNTCEYCKPKPKLLFENRLELMIISETLDIEVEGDYSGSGISDYVDINYCPMCGRKLKED